LFLSFNADGNNLEFVSPNTNYLLFTLHHFGWDIVKRSAVDTVKPSVLVSNRFDFRQAISQ